MRLYWPADKSQGCTCAPQFISSNEYWDAGEKQKDSAALAMAAEALLNLFPWEYYQGGQLKPQAKEAERLVLAALHLDPDNPLANHLLIHISEASSPLR